MINKPKKCLIPGCPKNLQSRGLCPNHYAYASYRIIKGLIDSWSELESKGLALPRKKRDDGLFDKAYKVNFKFKKIKKGDVIIGQHIQTT